MAARCWTRERRREATATSRTPAQTAPARTLTTKRHRVSIHSVTVLQTTPAARKVWQFDSRFALNRDQTSLPGEPLPASTTKNWRSLFQRKLNIALLPTEDVFLRVAQFPASDFNDTLNMVELQLEK